MRDYHDGSEYALHPLRLKDPNFLQIFLYYDDVEVCNPIGSKYIIHKVGMLPKVPMYMYIIGLRCKLLSHDYTCNFVFYVALFYFVLGNIAPMFRSKVRRIQLVAIAKSEHFKKYGANAILKPIIEDIKKLVKKIC